MSGRSRARRRLAEPRRPTARRRLAGLAFLAVLGVAAWLSVALYGKTFSQAAIVTLYTDSAGNEMHPGAQVMVRGVQVGEVRQVSADGAGARLVLAIQPEDLARLPANLTAQMLPTTLFGERYVDLILPARPTTARLENGSIIRQDRASDALELERVLDNLLPLLRAAQPDKLSLTLTAIAQGLQGRGAELGRTLTTLNAYLRALNPRLPALDADIRLLTGFARKYTRATPDLLRALDDFSVTGRTIATQAADFAALVANLTTASDDLRAFLDANAPNMISLAADSLPTLRVLARYAPEFPCTLSDLAGFVPKVNKVFGLGTGQPGLHMQVEILPSRGRYRPTADTPIYGDNLGPHCYRVPFRGIRLHDGVSRPRSARGHKHHAAARTTALSRFGPGGLAGSPAEYELVQELTGLSLGRSPTRLPDWGGLLTAPLFRGTTVLVSRS